ncbi:hypothetical protein CEK27_003675 [Fusarium fujikuroi]|nr:hypothetical protein CEK27_003675 [Fusarium fujikuroi]
MKFVGEEVVMDSEDSESSVKLHNIHIKTADYRSRPQINSTGFSISGMSFDRMKSNTVSTTSATLGRASAAWACYTSRYRDVTHGHTLTFDSMNVEGDEPYLKAVAQENDADVAEDGDAQPAEALEAPELAKSVEDVEPVKPVAAKAAEPVKIPRLESTATKLLNSSRATRLCRVGSDVTNSSSASHQQTSTPKNTVDSRE